MNELEPRKVVGAGLLAAGFCLIVLAAFAAAPRTAWAQKDADQRGGTAPDGVVATPAAKVVCANLQKYSDGFVLSYTPAESAKVAEAHINAKCNTSFGFSTMVGANPGGPSAQFIVICCVPK